MKRYVMTKDKIIYDRTKMPTVNFDLDASVDKSSDNLLDLVEVGDCWESPQGFLHQVSEINLAKQDFEKRLLITKTIYCVRGYALAIFEDGHNEVNNINVYRHPDTVIRTGINPTAIWKRNGDVMRRYEL